MHIAMCIVAILAATALRPEAIPLAPGGTVGAEAIAFPGGTELDSICYANLTSANLTVDVTTAVYRSIEGTLDFYYQVRNDSAQNLVHRLTTSEFVGFLTDSWYILDGGVIPCAACPGGSFERGTQDPLTFDRDGFGEVVGFNFPTPDFEVDPGEASLVLLVRTDATAYQLGTVSVINSGSVTETAFQPSAAGAPPKKTKKHKNACT